MTMEIRYESRGKKSTLAPRVTVRAEISALTVQDQRLLMFAVGTTIIADAQDHWRTGRSLDTGDKGQITKKRYRMRIRERRGMLVLTGQVRPPRSSDRRYSQKMLFLQNVKRRYKSRAFTKSKNIITGPGPRSKPKYIADPNTPKWNCSGLMIDSLRARYSASRTYTVKATGEKITVNSGIAFFVAKNREFPANRAGLNDKGIRRLLLRNNNADVKRILDSYIAFDGTSAWGAMKLILDVIRTTAGLVSATAGLVT